MIDIYKASCKNVRELKKQAKVIKRLINQSLQKKRWQDIPALTNTYALLYSAFAETAFLKMLHTPYGFPEPYIVQIQSQRNLEEKWRKCIDLAFQGISTPSKLGEVANKKLVLVKILDKYIIAPSQIRNKIAHGQWVVCLNNNCTSVNLDMTVKVVELDYVRVDILFHIYDMFAQTIEDLIESPHRAHFRYFYSRLAGLENYVEKTAQFSFESKKKILSNK